MKLAKRLFALALVLCMVLCLSVSAFAATQGEDGKYVDDKTITITKVYKLENEGTTSPAETFTVEQVGSGTVSKSDATSAPNLGTITGAAFSAGEATKSGVSHEITINLPEYDKVGVYEYTLKEKVGTTAGVVYRTDNIKLVVTVIEQDGKIRVASVHTENGEGEKSSTIENKYQAGTLMVTKTVEGNLGDHDKYFEFKVTLTGVDDKTYGESYAVSGGSNTTNPSSIKIGEETTFLLKHGETISIANLPYGVSYTVTETAADGYATTKTDDTGSINAAEQTAAFTNTRTGEIDMGVYMDSLPYILALAVACVGAVVLFTRKRHVQD